jgi:hypothetical protein
VPSLAIGRLGWAAVEGGSRERCEKGAAGRSSAVHGRQEGHGREEAALSRHEFLSRVEPMHPMKTHRSGRPEACVAATMPWKRRPQEAAGSAEPAADRIAPGERGAG